MWLSRDKHWRVQVITLDGTQLYRVQTDTPVVYKGKGRTGPVRMAGGWYLAEDVHEVTDITRYIPLDQLEEQ